MKTWSAENVQLVYIASNKSAEELQFFIESLCTKQKDLLISLLKEEKDTIEDFTEQNGWAADRVQVIDSILSALDY